MNVVSKQLDYAHPVEGLAGIQVVRIDKYNVDTIPSGNASNITFNMPSHWFSKVKLSPFSNIIEDETVKWMKDIGVIPSLEVERYIRKMEPGQFAGYSLPLASYEHALLYCKFLTFGTLWDDVVVEKAKDENSVKFPIMALGGRLEEDSETSPWIEGFKLIGEEIERLGSLRFRRRLAKKMQECAPMAMQETSMRDEKQTTLTFSEIVEMRKFASGVIPLTVLNELSVGVEELLDEKETKDIYNQVLDKFGIICCISNDCFSVGKDIAHNQTSSNLILTYKDMFNTSITKAFQELLNINNKAVGEFDVLAYELICKVPEKWKEQVTMLLNTIRYTATGLALWQEGAARYQQYVTIENGHKLVVSVK